MVIVETFRGQHLVNFEADHSEIVGVNPWAEIRDLFRLVEENALASEAVE